MTILTKKERIEELKKEIRNAGYPSYVCKGHHSYGTIGTMYMKKKMDSGFHIYFIYEPGLEGRNGGVDGIVAEMYYDLRNREYWVKRNEKDVRFSERNVDTMFPSSTDQRDAIFEFLSTENNKGLYEAAFKKLGSMGHEVISKFGRFFYRLMEDHSYFEILYKAGILNSGRLKIKNPKGSNPVEILGITKLKWKMNKKLRLRLSDLQYNDDGSNDQEAYALAQYVKKLDEEFGFGKIDSFVGREFDHLYLAYSQWRHCALKIAQDYRLNKKRLIRYLYYECEVTQGMSEHEAIRQYEDYVRMSVEMGNERFEKYPRYLKTYHDIAKMNYKLKLDEIEQNLWDKNLEHHKTFENKIGDYLFIVPKEPSDLVKEGNQLQHCVSSYFRKVAKNSCTIVFLRTKKEPDKSFVTIEISDGKITQAKAKMNMKPEQEELDIIQKYANKLELEFNPKYY